MSRLRGLGWLLLAAAALAGSGCAMYSETRDKQGQELQAAWGKVELQAPVTASRKNFVALLEEQMAFEDELWAHARSVRAQQMLVTWTVGQFKGEIDQALVAVAGSADDARLDQLDKARRNMASAQSNLDDEKRTLATLGVSWPGCPATEGPKRDEFLAALGRRGLAADDIKSVAGSLASGAAHCKSLNAAIAPGGELHKAQRARDAEVDKAAAHESEKAEKVKAVEKASERLAAAEKALAADPASGRDKLTEARQNFEKAVDAVVKLQTAIGQAFLAQKELDTVNEFLTTYDNVVAGKGAPADSNRFAIALALFPDLKDKASAALKDVEKPNLVPLVQQKQLAQARLAAAERDIQRASALVQLHQAQVDQLWARQAALRKAQVSAKALPSSLDKEPLRYQLVPVKQSPLDQPEGAMAAAEAGLQSKVELWRVAALYLYAEGNLRAEVGKTRQRILAANYEKSIDYAESSLNQWKALLDPSVELMALYGASGTRVSDIREFLNTLALFLIAAGVE
ncbi:hypothetical protein [Pseudorhodoferax sp.]|uniref:hypothetical protein n=1 Tax=Pseudorhodoferax sp. TaxID=1993553 RepID=UPI002DD6A26E|nr:hypothetical protein [Pseudorhodoferax sp.]